MAIQKFDPNRRSTFIGNSAYRVELTNDDQTAKGQDFGSNVWQGVLGTELLGGKVGYVELTMPAPAGASAGFATDAFDYVINGGNYSVGTGAASWGLIGDAGGASVSYAGNDSLQWAGPVVSPGQTFGLIYHDSGRTWLVLPSGQIAHKPDGGGVGAVDYTPPTFDSAGNLTGGGVGTPTGISGPVRFGASAPRGQQMTVNADGPFALAVYLPANVAGWNAAATPAGIAASAIVALGPVLGGGGGQLALRATAAASLAPIGAGASGRLASAGTAIGMLGPVRVAATGRPRIGGSAAGRLGAVGVGGAAGLQIAARAVAGLDAITLTAAGVGQSAVIAVSTSTLAPIGLGSTAGLALRATAAIPLAAITTDGRGLLRVGATVGVPLGAITIAAVGAGQPLAGGSLIVALAPISAAATAALALRASLGTALGPVAGELSSAARLSSQAGIVLAPVGIEAVGPLRIRGIASASLGPVGLLATAIGAVLTIRPPHASRIVRATRRDRVVAAPRRVRTVFVKGYLRC